MTNAKPSPLKWIVGIAVLALCASLVWAIFAITGTVQWGVETATKALGQPGAPGPGPEESAAIALTDEGVPLTIKQRSSAWLPGGKFRLHLDDITSRQVLISITDSTERVVMGPVSVKAGQTITLENVQPAMQLEVVRLENLLTGEDFGEFIVKPADERQ